MSIPHPSQYVTQWVVTLTMGAGHPTGSITSYIYAHQGCPDLQSAQEFADFLYAGGHLCCGQGTWSAPVLAVQVQPG